MKLSRLSLPSAILAAVALTSCGTALPEAPEAVFPEGVTQNIVGGTSVTASQPEARHTVFLLNHREGGLCSGTLVAPNLVLTAAHCLSGRTLPSDLTVGFGLNLGRFESRRVEAYRTYLNPLQSQIAFPSFDVAWLRLSSAAPASHTPAPVFVGALRKKDPVVVSGYGVTASSGANNSGTLRTVTSAFDRRYDGWFRVQGVPVHLQSVMSIEAKGAGACYGDSGGPIYVRTAGGLALHGITAGFHPLANRTSFRLALRNGGGLCEAGDFSAGVVGDYASWIESTSGVRLNRVGPVRVVISVR